MNIDTVLSKFHNVKRLANGEYTARCPAHDDQKNSLTIRPADNRILLYCHANCAFEAIKRAAGLTTDDLQNGHRQNRHESRRWIVATYDYRDATGKLLYQSLRYEPKSFNQRHPDGNGGWVWRMDGVQRVLYRLPELLTADSAAPIFVVEGEKDADRLASLGLIATTNVGGAGKWKVEYNQSLTGRRVIILPDNDEPGVDHAHKITESLKGIADVKIVELPGLPPKGDVSDWLDSGHTKDDLLALADKPEAPPIKQTTGKAETPVKPGHDILRDRWLASQPPTAYGLGDFRQYHAGIWQPINELEVEQGIIKTIEAAKSEGVKLTMGVVSSVAGLVKREVVKPDSIWDADSDYLVCKNGTLYIPGRRLGEHRPNLYATSGVSYDYDPTAEAPIWGKFLLDLAKYTSLEVTDFLQEFAGYALTIDTRYELSIWLYGPPGSGKSTFLTGLEAMLGNRAGLLGLADVASNRFALANLPGKTLAISTEQPADYIASTHILNTIISGETITVERKFRDAIQVTPRCKLAWAMNELPRVSDPNSGLFRRVKVVGFPAIAESDRDPTLKEAIKTEGAGILNWALEGLSRLRNRGRFEVPAEVQDATKQFRDNNDIPGRFVEECCVTGNDEAGDPYRAQSSQFYNVYKTWCAENGHKAQSSTSIADDWKRLGFEKRRPGGVVYWFFVGLKDG